MFWTNKLKISRASESWAFNLEDFWQFVLIRCTNKLSIYILSISIHFTNCQISLTNILTYYCQKKGNCFSATRYPQNQDTARWFVLFVYHDKSFLTPWFVSKSVSKEGSLFLLIFECIFGNICFYVLELIFPNIFPAE